MTLANRLSRLGLSTLLAAASGAGMGCSGSENGGAAAGNHSGNGQAGANVGGGGASTGGGGGASTGGSSGAKGTGGGTGIDGDAGKGGAGTGTGGVSDGGTQDGGCTVGGWPQADPSVAGPFATVTENNVGPTAGVGTDGGPAPQFTLFRPKDMAGGLCHPVITWGNGTSANPSMYKVLLNHLASHGFVVIASNSPNVAQGTPAPMVVGVTWVLEQNDDPSSAMYQHIDTTHIGATGHSQGGFATTQAAGDSHITTMVPICGAMAQRNLHGPAMVFCGGADTTVPCSSVKGAFDAVTTLPAMLAEYVSADHGSWMTFMGSKPSPVESAVTAWMRVHLMDDASLRSWFYGASCKLCQDTAWQITQKNMDQ